MRKKYSKRLKQEIEEKVPDIRLNIKLNVNWNLIKANNFIVSASNDAKNKAGNAICIDENEENNKINAKSFRNFNDAHAHGNSNKNGNDNGNSGKILSFRPKKVRFALASIACVLLLTIGISIPLATHHSNGGQNLNEVATVEALTYDVTIDVNPSVRLTVNNDDVVTAQQGLNKDGVILLYNEDFVGKDVLTATNEVMEKIDEAGFFNKENSEFKFCLSCEKGKKIKDFQNRQDNVEKSVNQYFTEANLSEVKVKHITDARLDEIESYFKSNKIADYTKTFDDKFRQELISQLDERIENVDNILSNWLSFIFEEDRDLGNFTLDDFNEFCDKYGYPLQINEPITADKLGDMYVKLIKYKHNLVDAKDELKKGADIETLYNDIYEVYGYAKKWLYEAER